MKQANHKPPKWEAKTVGDMLTDDQVKRVVQIMKSTPNATLAVEKTYRYLRKFTDHIVTKGMTPRFLAYYFLYLKYEGML